jgi:SNF2 family DNA or RNA helicase
VYGFVSENVKNMIESGNIEGAIATLGGDKTDNIVELIKNKKEEELIDTDAKIKIYTMRNDESKIKEYEAKKNSILSQISDLNKKFNEMLNGPCNICYDTIKSPVLEINCQNLFCGECILKWLQCKNTCPLCRVVIDKKKLIYVKTDNEAETRITEPIPKIMTKVERIVNIIMTNQKGKYLIFSDHDGSFISIKDALEEKDITCVQIRGNIKNREKNISSFKSGDTQVIFLNSKYNGAGINLQEATDIILYHEMNFNIETQVIGRANRIGRENNLNVHHLQVKRS